MATNNKYKDYCVGCGLCKSEFKCKKYKEIVESNLTTDAKSFTSFQDKNANDIAGIK